MYPLKPKEITIQGYTTTKRKGVRSYLAKLSTGATIEVTESQYYNRKSLTAAELLEGLRKA